MFSLVSAKQNHLLAALTPAEFERLAAHLELVRMPLGEMLYEPGRPLQHVIFPTTAVVSLHYVLESGALAETAGVGNEGVVGTSLFMGENDCSCQPFPDQWAFLLTIRRLLQSISN